MPTIFYFILLILSSNLLIEAKIKAKTFPVIPKFIVNLIKNKADHILEAAEGNTQCAKDIKAVLNDGLHMKRWALEMLDATAKPPSGILAGNIYMNGNFDECLDVKEVKANVTIQGQYCTVMLTPSVKYGSTLDFSNVGALKDYYGIETSAQITDVLKQIKMIYGICIPTSCSIHNMQKLWDYMEHTFRTPIHMNFIDMMCSSKVKSIEPFDVDPFIFGLFGLYFLILLVSTLYDVLFYKNEQGTENSLWICFSMYRNAKKLFQFENDELAKRNYLGSISGVKVMCMLWVIYGHRLLLNLFSGSINLMYLREWKSNIFTTFNLSGSYSVDTFLMISGLLLSFGILSYQKTSVKQMKIPVVPLYIYRFLRLSPGLLALIMFNISIFKNLNSGPIWPLMAAKNAQVCLKAWFATLFFLNNYMDVHVQCMEHSWYLAVDSQLFFISPIVLNSLLKRPVKTCLVCFGVCIITGIYTFIITIRNNYGAIYFESNKPYLTYIYTPTIVRMPPWFIGIIFGYILFKYRNVKLNKVVNWFTWIIVFSLLIGLILVHLVFSAANEYNALNAAIFNSTARQLWALASGLLIFLCTCNSNGIINKFLSMPVFRILVRMSYSIFLIHAAVLFYFVGGKKHSTYFTDLTNIHDFLGDLPFVFIFGTLWCLAFESPFIAVARHLYQKEMISPEYKVNKIDKRKRNKKNKNNYVVCVYKYEQDDGVQNKKYN